MLKGDFANGGCDLREACSSQLHSCRKKHEEFICLCLYFYSRPTLPDKRFCCCSWPPGRKNLGLQKSKSLLFYLTPAWQAPLLVSSGLITWLFNPDDSYLSPPL